MMATVSTGGGSGSTSVTFGIPRTATIESDRKPHKVTIAVLTLPIELQYTTVPRLSEVAYVRANATNSSAYPLLSGPAAVFFDHDFVTTTELAAVSPGEAFEVYLGADGAVRVKHVPVGTVSDRSGGLFTSKKNVQHIHREFIVKNTKQVAITIKVLDSLPLPDDEKISVKLITPDLSQPSSGKGASAAGGTQPTGLGPGGAVVKLLNDTNAIEWNIKLEPGQSVTLPFKYTVEWPKEKAIEYHEVIPKQA